MQLPIQGINYNQLYCKQCKENHFSCGSLSVLKQGQLRVLTSVLTSPEKENLLDNCLCPEILLLFPFIMRFLPGIFLSYLILGGQKLQTLHLTVILKARTKADQWNSRSIHLKLTVHLQSKMYNKPLSLHVSPPHKHGKTHYPLKIT